ncbi:MAG: glycosyltransferase family 2 protein, partial [Patescibacteria group bacterium]
MEITTSRKLVSIGLPTYCGEKRISRALDSLCAQTYPEIEIIISDNASDDATATICQAYARRDLRIRFFQQKENIGRINNFLFVLSHAHGDYFMWAGDDDTWDTRFIETLVTGLDGNPKHGVALSSFRRERGDEKTSEFVSFAGTQSLSHVR